MKLTRVKRAIFGLIFTFNCVVISTFNTKRRINEKLAINKGMLRFLSGKSHFVFRNKNFVINNELFCNR